MKRAIHLTGAILLLSSLPASAQQFTGAFSATNDEGSQTIVRLVQSGQDVTGTMSGLGNTFELEGVLEDGSVVGAMMMEDESGLWFEADLDGNDLYVTLVAPTSDGQPDFDSATTLLFTRVGAGGQQDYAPQTQPDVRPELTEPRYPQPQTAADQAKSQRAQPQQVQPGQIHDGTPQGIEWANFFANMKATQMESYSSGSAGGYSSRTDYHLCGNGQFFMADQNSVNVDVGGAYGYGGGSGSSSGTWRIITQGQLVGIELRYANGETSQHRLEYDYENSATYIDGSRWYITPTDQCG